LEDQFAASLPDLKEELAVVNLLEPLVYDLETHGYVVHARIVESCAKESVKLAQINLVSDVSEGTSLVLTSLDAETAARSSF